MKKKKSTLKNFKQCLKRNKKMIFTVLLLLLAISVFSSFENISYARITDEGQQSGWDSFNDILGAIVSGILQFGMGVLGAPFAAIFGALALLLFLILWLLFTTLGVTDGLISFPFPDTIVFNKVPFFDPNFINPTSDASAPVHILQGTISSLYYTFFTIAITVFVIAAMVIGIKLALSSIGSEKAQYKQALNNWIFGIVLLFTVHILMAGIFALNEGIVEAASHASGGITFTIGAFDWIPVAGNVIGNILDIGADLLGTLTGQEISAGITLDAFPGYAGIIIILVIKTMGGDLIAALTLLTILGQTVALVIMYIKRLFYCIILGIMAPLIVAVDVIKKSIS